MIPSSSWYAKRCEGTVPRRDCIGRLPARKDNQCPPVEWRRGRIGLHRGNNVWGQRLRGVPLTDRKDLAIAAFQRIPRGLVERLDRRNCRPFACREGRGQRTRYAERAPLGRQIARYPPHLLSATLALQTVHPTLEPASSEVNCTLVANAKVRCSRLLNLTRFAVERRSPVYRYGRGQNGPWMAQKGSQPPANFQAPLTSGFPTGHRVSVGGRRGSGFGLEAGVMRCGVLWRRLQQGLRSRTALPSRPSPAMSLAG